MSSVEQSRRHPPLRSTLLWLLGAAAVCTGLCPVSSVPASVSPAAAEKLAVHLRVLGTHIERDGTNGDTSMTASADAGLAPDETALLYVSIGGFDADGKLRPGDLWQRSVGRTTGSAAEAKKKQMLDQAAHVIWAEVRALPSGMGKVAFEVKWDHFASERRGEPVRVSGDTRRIVMNEGENHVLEFLAAGRAEGTASYQNVIIDLKAEVQEDPALSGESIGYDLWLKHTDRQGTVTTRRVQTVGRQGEKVEFRFAPMRFPVPGAVLEDGSPVDSVIDGLGAVRGRVRPDGGISVDVGVTRWVGAAGAGSPRTGGIGGGGRKEFTLAPGETVSMVLPPPEGRYGIGGTMTAGTVGPQAEPPNTGGHPMVWIDNREFYGGHRDELVLTVRREP